MKRFLFLLALGAAGALAFRAFLFEGVYLASGSMAPTLSEGTHVFVNKWVYLFNEPERGDIVSFRTPQRPEKGLIKRVIAVGGDVIEIRRKRVFLNGQRLDEPYVQHLRPDTLLEGDNIPPTRVPEGSLFVMGDNRDYSGDSRDWIDENGRWRPFVSVESVSGRVILP